MTLERRLGAGMLGADNSINFAGGDATNTLTVAVLYTVLDV